MKARTHPLHLISVTMLVALCPLVSGPARAEELRPDNNESSEVNRDSRTPTEELAGLRQGAEMTQGEYDALAFPKEFQPNLPTFLIVGDSVSIDYTPGVRKLLKGKANVFRPNANCASGGKVVASYDAWIEFLVKGFRERWEGEEFAPEWVLVNFGLHDGVIYVRKSFRNDEERWAYFRKIYRPRLEKTIQRIRSNPATETARIVFIKTNPLDPREADGVGGRDRNVLVMNELVDEVMSEEGAEVLDVFDAAAHELAQGKLFHRDPIHYNAEGSAFLASFIAEFIESRMAKVTSGAR